ncbi:MAG: DJ-1/PfpI family protein [Verrucomicrobiae bacterium]|nr:DJ-1/PfpI family protein [Verrucomicrobiae bacterium]MCP5540391.1 DJ-1/PfpI family protein [Akkermansiaceae bacterium]
MPLNLAILIFDDVEVLDFCGPFEVFSVANRDTEPAEFRIYTVANAETVVARGGLVVRRHHSLEHCPAPDVLLIPGGAGVRPLLHDPVVTAWIARQATVAQITTSVCTGALLLGKLGLLDGLEATTHHRCIHELEEIAPRAKVSQGRRYIDTGKVITSAGISAGIEMSLHLVGRLLGAAVADEVAARMEYCWNPD